MNESAGCLCSRHITYQPDRALDQQPDDSDGGETGGCAESRAVEDRGEDGGVDGGHARLNQLCTPNNIPLAILECTALGGAFRVIIYWNVRRKSGCSPVGSHRRLRDRSRSANRSGKSISSGVPEFREGYRS